MKIIDGSFRDPQANVYISDNRIFYGKNRNDYHERCRFFNNVILVAGDFSSIKDATSSTDLSSAYHILKTGTSINLSQNSLSDKIKIAFSVINKSASLTLSTPYTGPDSVKIIVDFINTSTKKARLIVNVVDAGNASIDFSSNRYYTIEKNISDVVQEDGFSWADVTSLKIYACAVTSNTLTDNYYIGLDAIRIENVTTQNPLYGLTAYTVVKNSDEQPILKASNTNNYIEYRMSVGVQ